MTTIKKFPEKSNHPCYIANVLQNNKHKAFLVGGCVRDILLDRVPKDFDVVTSATPEEVKEIFPAAKPVGAKFGVMLLDNVEIATMRKEGGYSDSRHPDEVEYIRDERKDANRRDFTINAMYLDTKGNVHDFHGGIADILRKEIRCVGNPYDRFNEDPLRILRAIRFATRLGFSIEDETFRAMTECIEQLESISRERVVIELKSILSINTSHGYRLLFNCGALVNKLFALAPRNSSCLSTTINHLESLEKFYDGVGSSISHAMALAIIIRHNGGEKQMEMFFYRNKYDSATALEFKNIMSGINKIYLLYRLNENEDPKVLFNRVTYVKNPEIFKAFNIHQTQEIVKKDDIDRMRQSLFTLLSISKQRLFVTGDTLIELGYKPGPKFKEILDDMAGLQYAKKISSKVVAIKFLLKNFPQSKD